ncbi:hypothetical protein D3C84_1204320 [compost metagenome]
MNIQRSRLHQGIERFDVLIPLRYEQRIYLTAKCCAVTDVGQFATYQQGKPEIAVLDHWRGQPAEFRL